MRCLGIKAIVEIEFPQRGDGLPVAGLQVDGHLEHAFRFIELLVSIEYFG